MAGSSGVAIGWHEDSIRHVLTPSDRHSAKARNPARRFPFGGNDTKTKSMHARHVNDEPRLIHAARYAGVA
jgi:hypothetical protein